MTTYKFPITGIAILVFILSPIFSLQETAAPDSTYVFICLGLSIVSVVIHHSGIKLRKRDFVTILAFFSAVVSSLLGIITANMILKYASLATIYVLLSNLVISKRELILIFKIYFLVSISISTLIILSALLGYTSPGNAGESGRYSIDIVGVYKNPNYLVSFISLSQYVLLYLLICTKQTMRNKVLYILALSIIFYSILLTGTRAGLLNSSISLLLCLYTVIKTHAKGIVTILFSVICICVIIIFVAGPSITEFAKEYLGSRDMFEDKNRTDAWLFVLNRIAEHPLLGSGIGSTAYYLSSSAYIDFLHNIFLELLHEQGIVGLLCFTYIIFNGIKKINNNDKYVIWGILITSAFPLCFQNGFVEVNFWRFLLINRILIEFSKHNEIGVLDTIYSFSLNQKYRLQKRLCKLRCPS